MEKETHNPHQEDNNLLEPKKTHNAQHQTHQGEHCVGLELHRHHQLILSVGMSGLQQRWKHSSTYRYAAVLYCPCMYAPKYINYKWSNTLLMLCYVSILTGKQCQHQIPYFHVIDE